MRKKLRDYSILRLSGLPGGVIHVKKGNERILVPMRKRPAQKDRKEMKIEVNGVLHA